ncbi:MAG: chorismate synthase [Clostridia bacterium]|nr:chorismate synthase [Clostridia bacterium]
MSCSFGEKFKITVFGQSHSEAIGVVIDGIPAGIKLDTDKIGAFMSRRAPGKNAYSTKRKETDIPEIVSGVVNGITCGAPICATIRNSDQHSKDYSKLKILPRPSHSDFAAYVKHNGFNDIRGGGNFSGRMTAPMCFAGAIAMQILEEKGIRIAAHIEKIAGIRDERFDPVNVDAEQLKAVSSKEFPLINDCVKDEILAKIEEARLDCDSVGGVIECAVTGLPAGIGEPMFEGIENVISQAVFAVPAIKGIEFGNGFDCADLRGIENNDDFIIKDSKIATATNNHGGILGGITSSMPLIFRVAVKPTPSIAKPQLTVNLETMLPEELVIEGRHDPCIVPRAVPCIEAVTAIALINLI